MTILTLKITIDTPDHATRLADAVRTVAEYAGGDYYNPLLRLGELLTTGTVVVESGHVSN